MEWKELIHLQKMVIAKKSLYSAMQSLYEKDEVFAQPHITADSGSKVAYHSEISEAQQIKAACKRRTR